MSAVDVRPAGVPRQRGRRAAVLPLACGGMAVVGLDTAIVNVAVPSIQCDLQVGPGVSQWVVVIYGLLLGGFLLLGGRLADRVGCRRIFLTGLAVFTGASLQAGLAPWPWLLIVARGVQGFGAALIAPAALALLATTFVEGPERSRAIAVFGAVGGVAGSVGVVLGGVLTAGPGWRWSFWINVPAGILLLTAAARFLRRDGAVDHRTRLDTVGAGAVTGGLLVLVYAFHQGASNGWASGPTIGWFAVAVALLGVFVRTERHTAEPLVPPTTARDRRVVVACIAALLSFAALLAFIFTGSLFMQQVMGYSPALTGVAWLSTTITVFAAAIVAGRLAGRVPVRWLLVAGLTAVTVGTVWLTGVPADSSYLTGLLPAFLLAGIGFGFCGPTVQLAALAGVRAEEAGLVSGLVETMREIGGAAGVAAVATVLAAGGGLAGFHTAFGVIGVIGIAGVLITASGLRAGRTPVTGRTHGIRAGR